MATAAAAQEDRNVGKSNAELDATRANEYLQQPADSRLAEPVGEFSVGMPDDGKTAINPKALEMTGRQPAPWLNGALWGYHGGFSNYGAFGNMAGAGIVQQWGKLTLTGNANLSKAMVNAVGVVNSIGGSAALSYSLGENASLTVFGGINSYGYMSPTPAATTGYYGGFLTLNTNNGKWGMDLGARQVYNSATGRWETVPIVMPYYNLNGAKLGFDFGGMIRSLFESASESANSSAAHVDPNRRGPAIIAPPIDMRPPKMKPTEMPKSMQNTSMY